MKISEATSTDIPAIHALVNSAYRGETSRKGWTTEADLLDGIRIDEETLQEQLLAQNAVILTCIDPHHQIVGCVYLQSQHDKLYLGMLTVAPHLQAKGIGKLLLQASEEKARQLGCKSIIMSVISTRHELIDWYKRRGYRVTGEKKPFPASEKFGKPKMQLEFIVMKKEL
jgi:ribosomal protein S18 acetylase RimI-like enzyme